MSDEAFNRKVRAERAARKVFAAAEAKKESAIMKKLRRRFTKIESV